MGDAEDPPRLKHHRSEEHTSELQSLCVISYAVFCLKKKTSPQPPSSPSRSVPPSYTSMKSGRTSSACTELRPSFWPGSSSCSFFFFNDTATTEIYTTHNTLSLHDALPISGCRCAGSRPPRRAAES